MASSNSRNPKDLRSMISLESDKSQIQTIEAKIQLKEEKNSDISGDSIHSENEILKSRIDEQSHLIMKLKQRLDTKTDTSHTHMQDMGDMQNNLSKLKGLAEDDKTEIAMLRSRIDEQSQLIMILKQKADNASSHYHTLERVNKELIEFRDNAADQIDNEIRKYNILNKRFDELAYNHQEMIKFKDEYKRSNQELRLENSRLRDENSRLFSEALLEKDSVIADLGKKLENSKEQYTQLELRFRQNVQEHRSKEENLRAELKTLQEQLKSEIKTLNSKLQDTEEKLKAANYKLQNQIEGRKNSENETSQKLLQRESAAVNANLQVRKLREELTETDSKYKEMVKHNLE
ncbi:hypothetical protein KUTeg_008684 [Tegillarca granosa]|uniref:Uncharacterized protein n=1 Tax=Tegillarca granosa TaxID=220873 RepID=A0ABQ9F9U0_TEGGR|nr:hypothetical protein KUTeg_008684 [Tegillarca granosa]